VCGDVAAYISGSVMNKSVSSTVIIEYSKQNNVAIQFSSNHPLIHKLAAFDFYINRMLTLPITKLAKQQEWKIILALAQNSGFPLHIIQNLKKKLIVKKTETKLPTTTT
jgi:predicted neuraminidase